MPDTANKNEALGRRRVVITGLGLLTPAGATLEEYWANITSGNSSLRKISRVSTEQIPIVLGGEIDDACWEQGETPGKFEKIDRALLLCRSATRRALLDSGITASEDNYIGISLGTGAGPTEASEEAYIAFAKGGPSALRPRTVTRLMFNSISAHVALDFKLKGPQMSIASACASANMAMSRAIDFIRAGRSVQVVTGGVEMPICQTVLSAWAAMRVCSNSSDPNSCSLPFNKRRAGIALAEGAGMFVFEEYEHARSRGAKIYAEVLGYGENNDATHITQPDSSSQSRAMHMALKDSGIHPEEVDYINAHGTGTDLNDLCETEAIKKTFGDAAKKIAISSTKSVFGHALGASGAIELPAILGAFKHQTVPPTANLDEADPRCDLDYVPCKARPAKVNIAISNSFAFGGANSVLVFRNLNHEA